MAGGLWRSVLWRHGFELLALCVAIAIVFPTFSTTSEPTNVMLNILFVAGAFVAVLLWSGDKPTQWPALGILNVLFWAAQLVYAAVDSEAVGLQAHRRIHGTQLMSAVFTVLGFLGGIEPGETRYKLLLMSFAALLMVVRLWILAASLERLGAKGQQMAHVVWFGGIRVLVGCLCIGGTLGILARARLEDVREQLRRENAALAEQNCSLGRHTTDLELARREALLRESMRRRSSKQRGGGAVLSSRPAPLPGIAERS